MKYIKTLELGNGYYLCETDGGTVGRVANDDIARDIICAVNGHDALVAQRDALAGALTLVGVYLGLWPPEAKTMQARHCAELSEKITEALALVWEEAIDA